MNDVRVALDKIAERRPVLIDLSLTRIHAALAKLGDPHKRLPPVFHVAGTNGKGSTIAYIRAILEACGNDVHVFTSPHLVRYNERIVVAGAEISDQRFVDVLARCDGVVGDDELTFFEMITCTAFLAFSEAPADYLALEVGLGGRLDATNVIDKPLAAVITPVAFDHQDFLGRDLASIAAEKAGIFRPGAPAVVGPQPPEAMAVFEQRALGEGAALRAYGTHWDAYAEHGRLVYQDENGLCDLSAPRLVGGHQIANAGLAVAAIKSAGIGADDHALSTGIERATWPGRLQRLKTGPLIELLRRETGEETEIWLDGGHNPHAARAVAAALGDMEEKSSRPLILIAGIQANKDAQGFFKAFDGIAAAVIAVRADHHGAAKSDDVASAAIAAGLPARACGSVEEAVLFAAGSNREPPRILVCGSLFLAGEILAKNG